jgi:hypothetical protein
MNSHPHHTACTQTSGAKPVNTTSWCGRLLTRAPACICLPLRCLLGLLLQLPPLLLRLIKLLLQLLQLRTQPPFSPQPPRLIPLQPLCSRLNCGQLLRQFSVCFVCCLQGLLRFPQLPFKAECSLRSIFRTCCDSGAFGVELGCITQGTLQ